MVNVQIVPSSENDFNNQISNNNSKSNNNSISAKTTMPEKTGNNFFRFNRKIKLNEGNLFSAKNIKIQILNLKNEVRINTFKINLIFFMKYYHKKILIYIID